MKRLYLLRHAEASASLAGDDKSRPLSEHGITQAKFMAARIRDVNLTLCSSAKRTMMTLANIEERGADVGKVDFQDALYNAPAGDLLNALHQCDNDLQNILMIAHNPGIHQLAHTLMGSAEDNKQKTKLELFYNPATLSVFECPIENWKELSPRTNKLVDLIIPE